MLTKNNGNSPIKNFIKNKTIFVTGGFGFVGKLLVEKLLKYKPKKIYLLARPKKGKNIEERFENFLNEPVSGFLHLSFSKKNFKQCRSSKF